MTIDPAQLLAAIPLGLRKPLFECYLEIARNYVEHRWEPSELNGGKLCEVVYCIIDGATSGTYVATPHKPARLVDACRAIEQRPSNASLAGDRSLRVLIPRLLPFLYEIRNNRNVGHVGGDVDPNYADATMVLTSSTWILAELVRIFHGVTLVEAQKAVDGMIERKHPLIWEVEDSKRVLDPHMLKSDQTLVLLYSEKGWLSETDLRAWTEYQNLTMFRNNVLKKLHSHRLIEYSVSKRAAQISPLGVKEVEDRILKH